MNFAKLFILIAVVMMVLVGQGEAGWLKKIGKKIEKIGRNTRNTAIKTLDVAQRAANVVGTFRG